MFGCVLYTLFLNKSRKVNHIFEFYRLIELFKEIEEHFAVAVRTLLVRVEHLCYESHILFRGKGSNSVCGRQRLKTEFTAEACKPLAVVIKRLLSVPYVPHMGVAPSVARYALSERFTDRRRRDVRRIAVQFVNLIP